MAIDRSKVTKQAESFLAAGKFDRALDEFQKLIDDKPDDFNLLNRMGDVALQSNKRQEAVELFRKAANGYEREGFLNKATAVLKKAHRGAPEDVDVATRLAELYRQTSMIKEAIQIHIEVAEIFTKKGLIKRALEEFAHVVDLDPKNLKNKIKLADLYNKEGMKDRAAAIYLEVAEALALEQMHGEAAAVLDRAKAMVNTPQLYLTQSRLCIIQKDLVAAAAVLREGMKSNPRSGEILEALAEVELQAKHPEQAMEVLAQVPQLAEKTLAVCERAMRELARSGRVELALQHFQNIGREFSRRGSGELAARTLNNALQGNFTLDAWLQLAEIHHQSGQKQERIRALANAYNLAQTQNDENAMAAIQTQLDQLGATAEQMSEGLLSQIPARQTIGDSEEMDPVRRMQIEQLERDADNFMRNRFNDRAQEAFSKILELDPTNRNAINRIADIIQASGKMSQVQMHYVKMAEKLAPMGRTSLATEMLDKAEALFPGSTRMYRRTLGLVGAPAVAPTPAQGTLPSMPLIAQAPAAIPLAPPPEVKVPTVTSLPPPPPSQAAPLALEALPILPLDLPLQETAALPVKALLLPQPAPMVELTKRDLPPPLALPEALQPPPFEAAAVAANELQLSDLTGPEMLQMPGLEPLELEPLAFLADVRASAPPPAVDEELAAVLPDIDFQLDYGSPEEAKLAIQDALKHWPKHPELMTRLDMAENSLKKLGHEIKPQVVEESEFNSGFFDLTDVLGEALSGSGEGEEMHDATNVVEKIQSVEELFDAFREGVEQQVRGDDYDTHYNLGIAYKEMMLIEPAMEEFKKAMRDPERTLECCSMLSICEMSQGNVEGAIEWLRKGIEAPGFPPEDSIGLRFDLGEALLLQGRVAEAKAEHRRVYELDPDYRDVASKI